MPPCYRKPCKTSKRRRCVFWSLWTPAVCRVALTFSVAVAGGASSEENKFILSPDFRSYQLPFTIGRNKEATTASQTYRGHGLHRPRPIEMQDTTWLAAAAGISVAAATPLAVWCFCIISRTKSGREGFSQ